MNSFATEKSFAAADLEESRIVLQYAADCERFAQKSETACRRDARAIYGDNDVRARLSS